MSANGSVPQSSRYLDYLPAIYQQDAQVGAPNFLGRFLLAFEQVFTGLGNPAEPGLEEILDGIPQPSDGSAPLAGTERYFNPGLGLPSRQQAPAEFLDWLAGWVALSVRADLDELRKRDLIARAVSLYQLRGTKRGLEDFVRIYTLLGPRIEERDTPFEIGVHSQIGVDTQLSGSDPHFFQVTLRLATTELEQIRQQVEVATAIIDMEKPAHTRYALDFETPELQIGDHSHVGVDTLLGSGPA